MASVSARASLCEAPAAAISAEKYPTVPTAIRAAPGAMPSANSEAAASASISASASGPASPTSSQPACKRSRGTPDPAGDSRTTLPR